MDYIYFETSITHDLTGNLIKRGAYSKIIELKLIITYGSISVKCRDFD